MNAVARGLRAFGRFWWDFLVGEAPEIFLATMVVVGVAVALRHQHWVDVAVLPLLVVVVLVASSLRGRRRSG